MRKIKGYIVVSCAAIVVQYLLIIAISEIFDKESDIITLLFIIFLLFSLNLIIALIIGYLKLKK